MNVTPDVRKVLMALDSSPKAERYFSTGGLWGLGILTLIGHMVKAGYASRDADGDLDITEAGKKALDESMQASIRAMPFVGVYQPPRWNVRAGADAHLRIKSRGMGV